jgi:anti-sigma regulatory factor (Ser/Thr protein kinase)
MAGDEELRCAIDDDLSGLRAYAAAYLAGQRLDDLEIAANEAAANVLDHAGGTGTLTARHDDHGITVEITDDAGTLTPEHLQLTPDPTRPGGFGLWIINRLCDQVSLDHPEGRSRLILHMHHAPTHQPAEPATSAEHLIATALDRRPQ